MVEVKDPDILNALLLNSEMLHYIIPLGNYVVLMMFHHENTVHNIA